jgi:hypothetical protein
MGRQRSPAKARRVISGWHLRELGPNPPLAAGRAGSRRLTRTTAAIRPTADLVSAACRKPSSQSFESALNRPTLDCHAQVTTVNGDAAFADAASLRGAHCVEVLDAP